MSSYTVLPIDEHTWRIEDPFRTYLYLIEGTQKSVLFDTGNGFPGLPELVGELTDRPAEVVLSHGHFDHTGCAFQFETVYMAPEDDDVLRSGFEEAYRREEADFFTELYHAELTQKEREFFAKARLPKTWHPLKEGDVIDPGGRPLEVIAAPGHTMGSICLLDRSSRMLFAGDAACDEEILVYFDHSGTVEDVLRSDEKLYALREEFDRIWPGHHRAPLDASILSDYIRAAEEILENPQIGERVELADGYKLLHRFRTIGISYTPEHVRKGGSHGISK